VAARFNAGSLDARLANKRALQARAGLPARDVPLVAMVSRLDWQKGLDITGHVIHCCSTHMPARPSLWCWAAARPNGSDVCRPGDVSSGQDGGLPGLRRGLAQLIYAGADIFLMPSRFEPWAWAR
jgi:starch synthase